VNPSVVDKADEGLFEVLSRRSEGCLKLIFVTDIATDGKAVCLNVGTCCLSGWHTP
jgi:hypothetical protein